MGDRRDQLSAEEELELVRGCAGGDPACWHRLYLSYRRDAWRILCRILGPSQDLEDLVQTVFIKVHRSLGRFEGRSRFSTWLYRICVHVAMDHLRRKQRRREIADLEAAGPLVHPGADPSEQAMHRQAVSRLQRALAKLKEAKRNVLILHDLMEVPADEIGRLLDIPVPTVRTRLFHARRELARQLVRQKRDRNRP
ncbi:MAG: sigma-70 family RNA polymerase sigma factor [Deltaproteobacteria bacterium]|nr:sigma-70 family RNA polymerase sigma factor [Deltaproteobacteria bacterium]